MVEVGQSGRTAQPIPLIQPTDGPPVADMPQPKRRATAARPIPVAGAASSTTRAPAARPIPVAATPIPVPSPAGVLVRTDEESDEQREVTEVALRSAPPWLVSAVVHMAILILLGVLFLVPDRDKQVEIEAVYAEEEGEQLIDAVFEDLSAFDMPDIEEPAFAEDLTLVDDPFAAPPELDLSIDAFQSLSDIEAPSIGIALSGREEGAKRALLGAYGGTATTEAAVEMGLQWLAKQQDVRSGLWSLRGPYTEGGGMENQLAATAMALLAFQGAGNTHKSGKYKRNVSRGVDALVRMQDDEGDMFREGWPQNHRLYSQAQATIVLCELYGMTEDARYRKAAQKALDYAAKSQSPTLGGWKYIPRQNSDTSVTGWFVMALQSGRMAGLDVQSPTLDLVTKYLDMATPDGSFYSYQANEVPKLSMTAEALLCRQYLGWAHDDPRLRAGVDYLLENPISYDDEDVYYWYYATQVLHHMGGKDWDQWNNVMRARVPARQITDGPEKGSWSSASDRWGHHGGRLYTTCLSIYMLEVYYRHLPIYKHRQLPSRVVAE
jgi:hypothetical protein